VCVSLCVIMCTFACMHASYSLMSRLCDASSSRPCFGSAFRTPLLPMWCLKKTNYRHPHSQAHTPSHNEVDSSGLKADTEHSRWTIMALAPIRCSGPLLSRLRIQHFGLTHTHTHTHARTHAHTHTHTHTHTHAHTRTHTRKRTRTHLQLGQQALEGLWGSKELHVPFLVHVATCRAPAL